MSVVLSKNLTKSPVYQRTIPLARSRKELRNQHTTNAEALSPQERPCDMASILNRDLHPRPTIGISLFGEDCRRHPTKSSRRVGFTRTNTLTGSPPVIICVLCSCQTRSNRPGTAVARVCQVPWQPVFATAGGCDSPRRLRSLETLSGKASTTFRIADPSADRVQTIDTDLSARI
jgi:hypothetical protein